MAGESCCSWLRGRVEECVKKGKAAVRSSFHSYIPAIGGCIYREDNDE